MSKKSIPTFKLKHTNSDFIVNEIYIEPEKCKKSDAKFTYVIVQKEGLTTFELLDELSSFFGVNTDDVSASGLKDEEAITTQIISINSVLSSSDVDDFNSKYYQLTTGTSIIIKDIHGYGLVEIPPRKLHSNKFLITIRNLDSNIAKSLEEYVGENKYIIS